MDLFKEFQPSLVKFLNSDKGRELLSIDKRPHEHLDPQHAKIVKVLPNGYGMHNGKIYSEIRFSGDVVLNRLEKYLEKNTTVKELNRLLDRKQYLNYKYNQFAWYTNPTKSTADGSSNPFKDDAVANNWATARNTADAQGLQPLGTANQTLCMARFQGGNNYTVARVILPFDLTGRPTVASATFNIYTNAKVADTNTSSYVLQLPNPATWNSIINADFNTTRWTTEIAARIAYTSIAAAASATTFPITTLSAMVDGTTDMGLRVSRDIDNSAPTGDNRIDFETSAVAGKEPYINITAVTASGGFFNFF